MLMNNSQKQQKLPTQLIFICILLMTAALIAAPFNIHYTNNAQTIKLKDTHQQKITDMLAAGESLNERDVPTSTGGETYTGKRSTTSIVYSSTPLGCHIEMRTRFSWFNERNEGKLFDEEEKFEASEQRKCNAWDFVNIFINMLRKLFLLTNIAKVYNDAIGPVFVELYNLMIKIIFSITSGVLPPP